MKATLNRIFGTKRQTRAEAARQGWVTAADVVQTKGVAPSVARYLLLAAYRDGTLDRVKLAGRGGQYAYREKRRRT